MLCKVLYPIRRKFTSAVSEIMHYQGLNLKLDGLLNLGHIPNMISRFKVQKKIDLSEEIKNQASRSSDEEKRVSVLPDVSNNTRFSTEELESQVHASDNSQEPEVTDQFQSASTQGSDFSDLDKKGMNNFTGNYVNADISKGKGVLPSDYEEYETKAESSSFSGGDSGIENVIPEHYKMQQHDGKSQTNMKEENSTHQKDKKTFDCSSNQNPTSFIQTVDKLQSPASPSENHVMDKGGDNVTREEKSIQSNPNGIITDTLSFSVSQALDALTGMDDSTQVAVSSVFHVAEDMITQLDAEKNDGNETRVRDNEHTAKDKDNFNDKKAAFILTNNNHQLDKENNDRNETEVRDDEHMVKDKDNADDKKNSFFLTNNNHQLKDVQEKIDNMVRPSDSSDVIPSINQLDFKEMSEEKHVLANEICAVNFLHWDKKRPAGRCRGRKRRSLSEQISAANTVKYLNTVSQIVPINMTKYFDGESLDKKYLQNYMILKPRKNKSLYLDAMVALFLDYFPEEGQQKLLEEIKNKDHSTKVGESNEYFDSKVEGHFHSKIKKTDIGPSYVILNDEKQQDIGEKCETTYYIQL